MRAGCSIRITSSKRRDGNVIFFFKLASIGKRGITDSVKTQTNSVKCEVGYLQKQKKNIGFKGKTKKT